jgi:hypothetical protein
MALKTGVDSEVGKLVVELLGITLQELGSEVMVAEEEKQLWRAQGGMRAVVTLLQAFAPQPEKNT